MCAFGGSFAKLEVTQNYAQSVLTYQQNLFECTSFPCSRTTDSCTHYFGDDQKHRDDVFFFSVSIWEIFIRKEKPGWGETKQRDVLSKDHAFASCWVSATWYINNHYESCCLVSPCRFSNKIQFPFSHNGDEQASCDGAPYLRKSKKDKTSYVFI